MFITFFYTHFYDVKTEKKQKSFTDFKKEVQECEARSGKLIINLNFKNLGYKVKVKKTDLYELAQRFYYQAQKENRDYHNLFDITIIENRDSTLIELYVRSCSKITL